MGDPLGYPRNLDGQRTRRTVTRWWGASSQKAARAKKNHEVLVAAYPPKSASARRRLIVIVIRAVRAATGGGAGVGVGAGAPNAMAVVRPARADSSSSCLRSTRSPPTGTRSRGTRAEEARTCPRRDLGRSGCVGGGGGISVLPPPCRAPRFCATPIQTRRHRHRHRHDAGQLNALGPFLRQCSPRHPRESRGICRASR